MNILRQGCRFLERSRSLSRKSLPLTADDINCAFGHFAEQANLLVRRHFAEVDDEVSRVFIENPHEIVQYFEMERRGQEFSLEAPDVPGPGRPGVCFENQHNPDHRDHHHQTGEISLTLSQGIAGCTCPQMYKPMAW